MLIEEFIEVKWTRKNRKHFESKGYRFTNYGDKLIINNKDLNIGSHRKVAVKCDYCGEITIKTFKDYYNSNKNNIINKDCCLNCGNLKTKEILEFKQENGLLTQDDNGYWTFRENRLRELKKFVEIHGHANLYQHEEGHKIWKNLTHNGECIASMLIELGYNPHELLNQISLGYYDNFENLKNAIQSFIDIHKRFPTVEELSNDLKINYMHISKHGGIYEIKRKMNYNDIYDYVDDTGFLNSSHFEYIVAQFLIKNGINYLREEKPFPDHEGNFRSDFSFHKENGDIIYLELWGYFTDNERSREYQKVKSKKKKLYEKYNLKLIQLNYKDIYQKTYTEIQEYLSEFFRDILNQPFVKFDNQYLYPPFLKDEDLLNEIMKYSDDEEYLPSPRKLVGTKKYLIYNEIIKRYEKYHVFAQKYNKKVKHVRNLWDKENIYKQFDDMIDKGISITQKNIRNLNLLGMLKHIDNNGGLIKFKIEYFKNNPQKLILEKDISWLKNVINKKFKCEISDQLQKDAIHILNNLHNAI